MYVSRVFPLAVIALMVWGRLPSGVVAPAGGRLVIADANGDGWVTSADVSLINARRGLVTSDPRLDVNGDGIVTAADTSKARQFCGRTNCAS